MAGIRAQNDAISLSRSQLGNASVPGAVATPDEATSGASSVARDVGPAAPSREDSTNSNANGNSGSNKRKRGPTNATPAGASTSSRGVANLTPEQLERKRANDREAQRAIRERTKQQIERLNERIRELESSQPYRDLQAVIAQKDAVQAENEEMKRQLASFMGAFGRFLGAQNAPGLEELAAAAERDPIPYQQQQQPQVMPQQDAYPPPHVQAPPDHNSPHQSAGSPMSTTSMNRPFQYAPHHPHQIQTKNWVPPPPSVYQHLNNNVHPDLAYSQNDERLGVDFLLDGNPHHRRSNGGMNGLPASPGQTSTPNQQPEQGHFSRIPLRIPATCPLDAILLDAVAERNRARAAGTPPEQVVGPLYPNWNHLLNRNTTTPNHPISKLIIDICRTFPDLERLPEQVAVIYIMFLITRWEVEPTKENYERLPEWVRPLPSALFTPHPCWLDYLPYPRLRDAATQTNPFPNFDTFFVPYTTTLSLNWPYSPSDVLLPTGPGAAHPITAPLVAAHSPASASSHGRGEDGPEPVWRMNPAFETHLRDLHNWTLGPNFRDTFPDWANAVRIKEEEDGGKGGGRRR